MRREFYDVICVGEALIDFISIKKGVALESAPGFLKAAGGAPANVSVGLSRLGKKAAFIGKLGDDPFGRFLRKTLIENNVDVSQLFFDKEHKTKLAFVSLTKKGERDFEFFGYESADTKLTKEEIRKVALESARILHFGSVSLASNPSREAIFEAIKIAKSKKILVSFDPNIRLSLWESPDKAREQVKKALGVADIIKMDSNEMEFVTGTSDLKKGCRIILEYGASLTVVTLGKDGCYYLADNKDDYEPGIRVKVKDSTGAGDGFVAGMLYKICDIPLDNLSKKELHEIFRFANTIGALTVTKYGGIPALPYRDEVKSFYKLNYGD